MSIETIFDSCCITCTECGKNFYTLNRLDYTYKTQVGFQCSYTCYNHAILRKFEDKGLSKLVIIKRLKNCEEVMRSQGKKILHPYCERE